MFVCNGVTKSSGKTGSTYFENFAITVICGVELLKQN